MAISRKNQTLNDAKGSVGVYTVVPQGGETAIRHRTGYRRNNSDAQVTQQGVMRDLSNLYKTLSMASIGQWNALGVQMLNKKGTKHLNGRQAFMSVNRSLVGAGSQPVTVAPLAPSRPAPLPITMRATAQLTGSGSNVFSLTVTNDSAYGDMVQVFATPFAPVKGSTSTVFKASSFKLIVLLPSMSNGVNYLTEAYVQTFGKPEASSTFALKFVGMSDTGFKTGPKCASALCLALSEEVAGDGDGAQAPHTDAVTETPEDGGLHVA